ncbi:hypothetical protein GCM10027293_13730 [Pontibacter aydingkolensis]
MLVFTACDPMEDVYEELDAQKGPFNKKDIEVALVKADYDNAKMKVTYFGSNEEAISTIPAMLNRKYPQLENGSSVIVKYNLVPSVGIKTKIDYTITEKSDYELGGARFTNFDSWSQIKAFLEAKFPAEQAKANGAPVEGRMVNLTYTRYDGSGSPTSKTVTDAFYFINGEWVKSYLVTEADYVSVNRNRYNNFTAADQDMLGTYFNRFLIENDIRAEVGGVYYVAYTYFESGKTSQAVTAMVYNGSSWTRATATSPLVVTAKFSKKNGVWVPDLTKSYTLAAADYTWISQQPTLGTVAQLKNLGQYGNFYQSWEGSANYWSNSNIVNALAALIKNKFPNEEVGQKFGVSYTYFAGGNKVNTVILIKRETGDYELAQEGE